MTATTDRPGAGVVAPPAPRVELTHKQIMVVMSGLLSGVLLASLDQTIVSTALPTIVRDLKGGSLYTWVTTAYLLTSTASTPIYGKISDLFGRKRVFQFAIVVFLVGSALSGLSQNMIELILFRGLQGLGAGGLISLALAIVGDIIPPRERGRYQGYFGATFGASSVLGPLIGGFLVQSVGWQAIFYVNIPIGLGALVITNRVLKLDHVRRDAKVDYIGATLLVAGVSSLLIAVQSGGNDYAWGSWQILGLIALGLVIIAAFITWELRNPEPLLPMKLFKNDVFRVSSLLSLVTGAVMFGSIIFLPQYFQVVRGYSPTESGLLLLPLLVGLLGTSIGSGRAISKIGKYRIFPIIGTALLIVGVSLMTLIKPGTNYGELALFLLIIGAGLGLFMQTVVLATQNAVEMRDLGTATSAVTFFRTMGGAVGASALGAVFFAKLGAIHIAGSTASTKTIPSSAQIKALPVALQNEIYNAFTSALSRIFEVCIPLAVLAFGISFLLREVPLRQAGGGAPAPPAFE